MWTGFPLFPEQASTIARGVDALYYFLTIVSGFFSILIFLFILYFAVRYRRRPTNLGPVQVEGHLGIELVWSVIPLALTLVMFGWGAALFIRNSRPPQNAQDVYVVGQQWMWKIQHQEGRREINELHVPVGQPVKLTMASQDVIHSFFIPAFRVKQDVVPGRYTTMWFEATKAGEYHLFCAEYCGTQHSGMIGRVVVMEPDDFQRWLGGSAAPTGGVEPPAPSEPGGTTSLPAAPAPSAAATPAAPAVSVSSPKQPASPSAPTPKLDVNAINTINAVSAGQQLFAQRGCAGCHTPGAPYPQLAGKFGTMVPLEGGGSALFNEDYIRESLIAPNAKISAGARPIMPTYVGRMTEEEILQIILYIRSLKPPEGQGL